ncbi:NAD(P)-dependent oxidoreductase [Pseudonocardia sp. GCM10023141]|uniref:NAD(P)-dependent oxidoreductase n=1 Tax=Pseudonocardia sp. GCM10023141 TaxID=3252653 RepID=UPI00360D6BBF
MEERMQSTIAVIGAGLMGSALAEVLLRSGRPAVVWNRTPDKCGPLAEKGATVASSAADAIAGSSTTVICISSSGDVLDLVKGLPDDLDLSGRCLVNLSTGAAEEGRSIGELVTARGGEYIDGTILVYPIDVGTPNAVIQYAGANAAWTSATDVLTVLAPEGTLYLGEDLDLPAVLDVALTGSTLGVGLASFIEGAAYATSHGVELDTVVAGAIRILGVLQNEIVKAAKEIAAGDFTTTQATLDVWHHGIVEYRDAIVGQGQPAFIMNGLLAALADARNKGYAEYAYTGQFPAIHGVTATGTGA